MIVMQYRYGLTIRVNRFCIEIMRGRNLLCFNRNYFCTLIMCQNAIYLRLILAFSRNPQNRLDTLIGCKCNRKALVAGFGLVIIPTSRPALSTDISDGLPRRSTCGFGVAVLGDVEQTTIEKRIEI